MGVVFLSYRAHSNQIAQAARLMVISWAFSLQFWLLVHDDHLTIAYLTLDLCLAAAFYQMSRRRFFPVPLFYLHLTMVIFHFYFLAIDQSPFWMLIFINRGFEMALAYIAACASYRILRRA